mmetsp:Transcript_5339/g.14584  ORF Transcript_5339/g.14584 Transcript_5339/m.14584 type:complete len:104 (-) Transcript_5339:86-397(-)
MAPWGAIDCGTDSSERWLLELIAPPKSGRDVAGAVCRSLVRWLFAASAGALLEHGEALRQEVRWRMTGGGQCAAFLSRVASCTCSVSCSYELNAMRCRTLPQI